MYPLLRNHKGYSQKILLALNKKIRRYRRVYVFFNALTLFGTLFTSVLTSLMLSQLLVEQRPLWYYMVIATVSAITTFGALVINFFVIKETVAKLTWIKNNISAEIVKFNNQLSSKYRDKNRDFYLFTSISSFLGNKASRQEVGIE